MPARGYRLIGANGKLIDHVDPDEALRRIENEAFRRTTTERIAAEQAEALAGKPAQPANMPKWARR